MNSGKLREIAPATVSPVIIRRMTHPQQGGAPFPQHGGRPQPGGVPQHPQPWPQQPYQQTYPPQPPQQAYPQPYPQAQPYQPAPRPALRPPLGPSPVAHGLEGDPRYPSPKNLRRALAFTVELLLHFGIGVGAFIGTQHIPALDNLIGLWALIGWIGSSMIDRILIQWAFCTSIGKAIFGLRVIRKDGGRPRLGQLVIAWLVGLSYIVDVMSFFGNGSSLNVDGKKYFLPTVRMKDVRMLRSGAWRGVTAP